MTDEDTTTASLEPSPPVVGSLWEDTLGARRRGQPGEVVFVEKVGYPRGEHTYVYYTPAAKRIKTFRQARLRHFLVRYREFAGTPA